MIDLIARPLEPQLATPFIGRLLSPDLGNGSLQPALRLLHARRRLAVDQQGEILSYEEIAEIVRAAAKVGVRSIRLTGGEPLIRKDLDRLVP